MSETIQQFDFSVNLLKALLWQYNDAPNVQAVLTAKQNWYNTNQEDFWDDWIANVFTLGTANDFGFIVWAIILGLPLAIFTPVVLLDLQPFGFDIYVPTNFDGQSNFAAAASQPINYTDAEKRLILQLRYRQITAKGTIPEINKILANLIVPTYGPCYVLDNYDMTMTLVCEFDPPFALSAILTQFDLIPRPAGVALNVVSTSEFNFGSLTVTGDDGSLSAGGTVGAAPTVVLFAGISFLGKTMP